MGDIRVAVLTCSDSRAVGDANDEAGHAVIETCEAREWLVVAYDVCADDAECIATSLIEMADMDEADVVLTLGGTGLGPRDITPEVTESVCERLAPGIAEAVRTASREIDPSYLLSRAIAGTRGDTLIVNLPGGTDATMSGLAAIIDHLEQAVDMMRNHPQS